jgi:hypothetical protein
MNAMTRIRTLTLLLTLPLLLAGCRKPAYTEVYVAPGVPLRMCLPQEGPDLFVTQEVTFQFPGGRKETAMAVIENKGGVMSLVASTPMGQTLFIIRMRGSAVTVDTRIPIPGDLDPRVLPALVQFALWPAEAVDRNLAPGIRFEQDGSRRILLRNDKVVWSVTREGTAPPFKGLVLENPALGMTVRIRTVED